MRATLARPNSHRSRRVFLRASAALGGGLLMSLYLAPPAIAELPSHQPESPPDAFVHIKPDGSIAIAVIYLEMGQGVLTSLPMILADEMDADWSQVISQHAPAGDVYRSPVFGIQMTGGSLSIANSFQQYRELGAKTRAMLIAAAAKRWRVAPSECRTENSVVYGPGNRSARYAELADAAVGMPVPEKVPLKTPAEFRLIGKPVRRLDSRAKCDGSQKFGLDLDLPGMLIALMARPPIYGARVKEIDSKEARSVSGVRDVFAIPLLKGEVVVVVADRFWTAKQARDRLRIDWDVAGLERPDSVELRARFKKLARTTGLIAASRGDPNAIDSIPAVNRIVAEYELPYLAHTPMEPLNATVRYDGDSAEAWVGSQFPGPEQAAIAQVLGLKPEQVKFNVEFAGGGFGRRGPFDAQAPVAAALVAKRLRGAPIKFVWTREDDVQGGQYRPMFEHRVEIGIGADGMPAAWKHVMVGQSFIIGSGNPFESVLVKDGLDTLIAEGAADTRYAIPNFQVSVHQPTVNVAVLAWRSVGPAINHFVLETLIDELATRANVDPIVYRLKLLSQEGAKLRAALILLDEKSQWRKALAPGHAFGVACSEYHNTGSACVAEVSIKDHRLRIHRVTASLHCGLAVNPLSIEAQYQGGVTFGLIQLMAAITLKDGSVEQQNFDGYTPPYIADAPATTDVHIVPSTDPPTAIGENPVPLIAPAVVNALARLTGKRHRVLPLVNI